MLSVLILHVKQVHVLLTIKVEPSALPGLLLEVLTHFSHLTGSRILQQGAESVAGAGDATVLEGLWRKQDGGGGGCGFFFFFFFF